VRKVLQVPGSLFLGDIGSDGTVLLSHDNARRGIMGLAPGETEERDLTWLDWSQPTMLSEDGRMLLISEQGEGGGPGYGVFLRRTDGSPAVRLGTGEAIALSPDGKWVIAQKMDPEPAQFLLLPTGAGQARPLTNDDIAHIDAWFLPDGKRFLFVGFKPGRPSRLWMQSIDGGDPVPVTEEGVVGRLVTPDGTRVLVRSPDGQLRLHSLDPDGGEPEPVQVVEPGDSVIRFTGDGRALLVGRTAPGGAVNVVRLDLSSGARTPVRTVTPLAGQGGIGTLRMTADGSAYIYGYGVGQSDLFLVKGLK
jgi:Tol biopolymer transport system component